MDTTAGAALRLGSAGPEEDPNASFWLSAELGYSFAGSTDMPYTANLADDDPRQFGTVDLPAIRPSGFANRITFGVSF